MVLLLLPAFVTICSTDSILLSPEFYLLEARFSNKAALLSLKIEPGCIVIVADERTGLSDKGDPRW